MIKLCIVLTCKKKSSHIVEHSQCGPVSDMNHTKYFWHVWPGLAMFRNLFSFLAPFLGPLAGLAFLGLSFFGLFFSLAFFQCGLSAFRLFGLSAFPFVASLFFVVSWPFCGLLWGCGLCGPSVARPNHLHPPYWLYAKHSSCQLEAQKSTLNPTPTHPRLKHSHPWPKH